MVAVETPEDAIRFASSDNFVTPDCDYQELTPDAPESAHIGILRNFADAICTAHRCSAPARTA